jgi:hypothetical protein
MCCVVESQLLEQLVVYFYTIADFASFQTL